MIELLYGKGIQYLYYPSFAIAENCPYIRRIKNNPTMADINQTSNTENFLEEPKKLTSMLNVLTILTFIGSGIGILLGRHRVCKSRLRTTIKPSRRKTKWSKCPAWVKESDGTGPNMVESAHRAIGKSPAHYADWHCRSCPLPLWRRHKCANGKRAVFRSTLSGTWFPFASIGLFIGTFGYLGAFAA